jgi:hypothetical protein
VPSSPQDQRNAGVKLGALRRANRFSQSRFFNGPWGTERASDPTVIYAFVAPKKGGINAGMTVRDPNGRQWNVRFLRA